MAGQHPDRDRRDCDRDTGAAAHRARDRLRERGQPAPGPRRGTVARARRPAGARGDPRPARAAAHPRDAGPRADRRRPVNRAHLPGPRPGAADGPGIRQHRLARVALRGLARARGLPGDRAHARVDRAPPHDGRRAQTGLTERRPSLLAAAKRADRRPGRTVSRPHGARGPLHQNLAGDGQGGPECPSPADGRRLRSVRAPDDAARGAPVRRHPRDGRGRGRTGDARCALDRRRRAVRLARRAADHRPPCVARRHDRRMARRHGGQASHRPAPDRCGRPLDRHAEREGCRDDRARDLAARHGASRRPRIGCRARGSRASSASSRTTRFVRQPRGQTR